MKRVLAFMLIVSLCLAACGGAALCEGAPEAMSAEETYKTGQDAEEAGDYRKALEYYQMAADMGVALAFAGIGDLYRYGYGMEQFYEKAAEYYLQAANAGCEVGVEMLKELVEEGYVSETYLEGLV